MHAQSSQPPGPAPASALGSRGCTCARLRRLTRRVTALYDRELAPLGLRVTQYALMSTVRRHGDEGVPMLALADAMDMDRTTLTRNLKPLVTQGWMRLVADPHDARVRRTALTAAGASLLTTARPAWQRAQHAVTRTLGEGNVGALHDWLDHVTPAFRPAQGADA